MRAGFDVVIAGAGPGGIAAAVVAAEAGKRVCLLDANPSPGGQIWRGLRAETAQHSPHGSAFTRWKARLASSGCTVWTGWQAVDLVASGRLRVESESESRDVEFERLILATGARERFLPFPGWTLPGVMGAGGAQALVKAGLDPRGKHVVVAGSGPLLLAVAASLARSGARVEGVFEQAPLARLAGLGLHMLFAQPGKLVEGARYRLQALRARYRTGSWVARVEGRGHVERVWITSGGRERAITCDWLACGYHLVPNLELPRLLGCSIADGYVAVDALQQSSVPGVACIGELTGIGGLEKALVEGQIAGYVAAGREPRARSMQPQLRRQQNFARHLDRAFAPREELRNVPDAPTMVCRCEDVTHGALIACDSWRQAKLHTRCGMGPCQGRICGAAAAFLYGWNPADTRPPVYPARVSTLAATGGAAGSAGR
jgi:NADPH-dependent 2,4-dienoyl-CoA reductase/sulfur reductase-like enzyme